MIKRSVDILVASAGLLLLLPFFIIVAGWVRIFSGPPVFFYQSRVGKDGKAFSLIKFRTMISVPDDGGFQPGDTHRITPVGRFLRRTKLDELPQLINVLKGEMSIVGPRPEVPRWVAFYPERWKKVLCVRPGITDPASIAYRNEETILASAQDPEAVYRDEILPHKLDLYKEYVESQTITGDFGIIIKTALAVFKKP